MDSAPFRSQHLLRPGVSRRGPPDTCSAACGRAPCTRSRRAGAELADRYDDAVQKVVAASSARPVVHLAVPGEYGSVVMDVRRRPFVLSGWRRSSVSSCATPVCR